MTAITLELPNHLVKAINDFGDQLPLILEMGMSRYAPLSTKAYMEAVDLLTQEPTLEKLATFRFSDDIEIRISELLDKNCTNQLSKAEEVELDRLSQLEEQMQLVKATAIAKLPKT